MAFDSLNIQLGATSEGARALIDDLKNSLYSADRASDSLRRSLAETGDGTEELADEPASVDVPTCPTDGQVLSAGAHRDGEKWECPNCQQRWGDDQVHPDI